MAVTPDGKTAFVANDGSGTVSTIDVKTRTKNPTDITVGTDPSGVAVTPDGKTAFVTNLRQRHGVDDRCEDQDQEPHRHPRRLGPRRGGGHAVSPVTGDLTRFYDAFSLLGYPQRLNDARPCSPVGHL